MDDRDWMRLIEEKLNTDREAAVREIAGFASHATRYDEAEAFLLGLREHANPNVRGIAVLGLGHLARVHRRSSEAAVSAVRAALNDPDAFVTGHADSAADDIAHFSTFRVVKSGG